MRESYIESQIPEPTASPIYLDAQQIARGLGRHLTESFLGSVTGAGGVGGTITGVPFEPVIVRAINAAGATPAVHESFFPDTGTARHVTTAAAAAANATPPTLTQVGENNWTVTLPVGMAPNGETLLVHIIGFRPVGGSL
jgi:hypothetical protein